MFVGIDQSFTSSGFVLLRDETIVDCFTIGTGPLNEADQYHKRGLDICERMQKYLDVYKSEIQCVGLEQLAFAKKDWVSKELAGLQYMMYQMLWYTITKNIKIVGIKTHKKLAHSSNATKQQCYDNIPDSAKQRISELNEIKKVTIKPKQLYDISDAYWIARCAQQK